MKSIRNDITSKILNAATAGLLILFAVFFLITQLLFPGLAIKIFGFRFYLISYTKSMEPLLGYNDLIVVKNYDFYKLNKGDIITFVAQTNSGGTITITHRIEDIVIDSEGNKFAITKGDAVEDIDTIPVSENGILDSNVYIGKYALHSKFLGHILAFFSDLKGGIALSVNLLGFIVISFVLEQSVGTNKYGKFSKISKNLFN